jgi:ribose transport system substrate-binding protein
MGTSRRSFLEWSASTMGAFGLGAVAGCAPEGAPKAAQETGGKRLRAAFSNNGLQTTWCAHGMKTAEWWGQRLGIDVVVYDSQLNSEKQFRDVEDMATEDWDFVAIQACTVGALTDPVRRLIDKGIPVIDMDTRIVPEGEDIGLWTFVTPDHQKMAELSTEAVLKEIDYKGKVVHTQGNLGHTGAQLRAKGFQNTVAKYPDIEVIDEQPGDWDVTKVGRIWDDLLVKHDTIDGAFMHNDDMAMAAVQAIKRSGQDRNIIFGGVDGQEMGLNGLMNGDLLVTVMNPAGRVHWSALMVGYWAAAEGQKKEDVPDEILIDGPVVTKDLADDFLYLMKSYMI